MNTTPHTEWLENVTYDELSVGQSARLLRTLTNTPTTRCSTALSPTACGAAR